jgi:hypothetical protein
VKKSAFCFALLLVFSGLPAAGVAARDLFVDNRAGDDRFDGTEPQTRGGGIGPFRTIARALRAVLPGDRIILANTGDPYRESVTVEGAKHSGSSYRDFEVWGNGATLDGSASIPGEAWESMGQGLWRFSPQRKSHQLLFLDGVVADRVVVEPGAVTLPTLEPLQWCLFDRYLYFRPEEGRAPDEYALSHSALPVGITLHDVRRVTIRDLTIQGFQLDGINAHDNVFEATLDGLTCRGNARSGISVGGASRVRIQRCVLGNNGAAQLRTEGYCLVRLVDCQLLDGTAPAIVKEGGRIEQTDDGDTAPP